MPSGGSKHKDSTPKAGWKRQYDDSFSEEKIGTLVKRAKAALSSDDLGQFQQDLTDALVVFNTATVDNDDFKKAVTFVARLHAEATFWDVPEPAAVAGAGESSQQPVGGKAPRGPEVQAASSQGSSADGQDVPAILETGAPAGESSVRLCFGTAELHQLGDQISFNKWIALMEKVTYNDNGLAEILVNFLFYAVALMQAYRSGASDDSREQKRMLEAWYELSSRFVAVLEAVASSGHPLWTLYRDVSCRDDLLQKVASGALSAAEKAEQIKVAFAAAALERKKTLAAEAKRKEESAAKTRAQPAQPAQSRGQSKNRIQCFSCLKWGHTSAQCNSQQAPPGGGGGRGRGNRGNGFGAFGGGGGGGYGHHFAHQGQWQYGYPQWPHQQ
jgi:hypothetical protein